MNNLSRGNRDLLSELTLKNQIICNQTIVIEQKNNEINEIISNQAVIIKQKNQEIHDLRVQVQMHIEKYKTALQIQTADILKKDEEIKRLEEQLQTLSQIANSSFHNIDESGVTNSCYNNQSVTFFPKSTREKVNANKINMFVKKHSFPIFLFVLLINSFYLFIFLGG